MIQIPIIAATSNAEKELFAGFLRFDGLTPYLECERDFQTAVREIVSKFEERQPVLVIDVKGLQKRNIDPVLLKRLKIHGAETWYLTNIESVDDVFDSFNTNASKVLMPCHTVRSQEELEDIIGVSDSIIPVIFVRNRDAVFLRKKIRPSALTEDLFDMGFGTVAVFDLDRSVSPEEWERMTAHGRIIPFSYARDLPADFDICFKETL